MGKIIKMLLLFLVVLGTTAATIRFKVKFMDGQRNVKAVKAITVDYDESKVNSRYLIRLVENNLDGVVVRQAQTDSTDLDNGTAVIKPIIFWSDTLRYIKIGKSVLIKR